MTFWIYKPSDMLNYKLLGNKDSDTGDILNFFFLLCAFILIIIEKNKIYRKFKPMVSILTGLIFILGIFLSPSSNKSLKIKPAKYDYDYVLSVD